MENKKLSTPMKAIRIKCLDCCAGSSHEVRLCPIKDCSLYPYRLGKNPNIKERKLTEEQKEVLRERVKKARDKKELKLQ